MSFLISPAEPLEIKALGTVSPVPEKVGVDILWSSPHGLCGAQRKTVSDLIASVRDQRLGKELEQMRKLAMRGLIIEGHPQWTRDGHLLSQYGNWTQKHHRGVMMSAQVKGVIVLTTRDHLETLDAVTQMEEWSKREEHVSSMLYRGNGKGDDWGDLSHRATAIHFLSGMPGLGVELAGRLFDHFGKVPFGWSVTREELLEVKGIGKKKVDALYSVLKGGPVTSVTGESDG